MLNKIYSFFSSLRYNQRKRVFWIGLLIILLLSMYLTSKDRRIINHDTYGYWHAADTLYFGYTYPSDNLYPGYPYLISFSYLLFGHTMLALHIFPYLCFLLLPLLLYITCIRIFKDVKLAVFSSILFMIFPSLFIRLNQATTEPIIVFSALATLLLFDYSTEKSYLLAILLPLCSWLFLVRYDSILFVLIITIAISINFWRKRKIPYIYLSAGIIPAILIQIPFALFNLRKSSSAMPVEKIEAWATISSSQDSIPTATSKTIIFLKGLLNQAVEISNEFQIPPMILFLLFIILSILIIMGTIYCIRKSKNLTFAIILVYFWSYLLIALFYIRGSILRHVARIIPFAIILIACGLVMLLKILQNMFDKLLQRQKSKKLLKLLKLSPAILLTFIILILLSASLLYSRTYKKSRSYLYSTSMLNIIKNPLILPITLQKEYESQLPKSNINIDYKFENTLSILYADKEFKKFYHPLKDENVLYHQIKEKSDFFYVDDFKTDKYKKDSYSIQKSSNNLKLWHEKTPGFLGLTDKGEATLIYKFEFNKPIDRVTISDYHINYIPAYNIVEMWTSSDNGKNWILRYADKKRKLEVKYDQTFETEFDGARSILIKYYFLNRLTWVSCLSERFYVAVDFKNN